MSFLHHIFDGSLYDGMCPWKVNTLIFNISEVKHKGQDWDIVFFSRKLLYIPKQFSILHNYYYEWLIFGRTSDYFATYRQTTFKLSLIKCFKIQSKYKLQTNFLGFTHCCLILIFNSLLFLPYALGKLIMYAYNTLIETHVISD